jgi:threonine/homoserine/homoserine lactone efflux protein
VFALDAQFLTFLVAVTLLTLSPGVDTMLVLRSALVRGRRAGVVTAFGICCGLFIHATLSALGVSAVLARSATAFELLKLAGAGYLIYLGLKGLHHALRRTEPAPDALSLNARAAGVRAGFVEGLLNNVLNPKPAVFYLAFLPQFIRAGEPALLKSLYLAGVHFIIGMVWLGLIVWLVGSARKWLSTDSTRRWLEGISGGVLLGLGVHLAMGRVR